MPRGNIMMGQHGRDMVNRVPGAVPFTAPVAPPLPVLLCACGCCVWLCVAGFVSAACRTGSTGWWDALQAVGGAGEQGGWPEGEGAEVEGGDGNGGGGVLVRSGRPTRSAPPQSPGLGSVGRCVSRCVWSCSRLPGSGTGRHPTGWEISAGCHDRSSRHLCLYWAEGK